MQRKKNKSSEIIVIPLKNFVLTSFIYDNRDIRGI